MAVLNESDYKTIYDVIECAGITNTDISDAANVLDMYTKIAAWINSDEVLSEVFTASITNVASSRNRLELLTSTGAGVLYGYRGAGNSGVGSHESKLYRFGYSDGNPLTNVTSVYNYISILNLKLMLIKSTHGFIADLYDANDQNRGYNIRLVHTTGKDSSGSDKEVTFLDYGGTFYSVAAGTSVNAANFLTNNSTSDKTGLFTLMVPGRDIICENVKLCTGRVIKNHTFFEAGGKTWCCAAFDTSCKGLALCIE